MLVPPFVSLVYLLGFQTLYSFYHILQPYILTISLNTACGCIDGRGRGGIPCQMHVMARGKPTAEAGGESQMLSEAGGSRTPYHPAVPIPDSASSLFCAMQFGL